MSQEYATLLHRAVRLLRPDLPADPYITYMALRYSKLHALNDKIYETRALPAELVRSILKNSNRDDENCAVILNHDDLIRDAPFAKLYDKDGIYLRTSWIATSRGVSDGAIYLSDALAFNLGLPANLRVRPCDDLPYAEEVSVSMLNPFHDPGSETVDALLRNYFSTPKLIREGDLIAVDCEVFHPEYIYASRFLRPSKGVLYFRCNQVLIGGGVKTGRSCLSAQSRTVLRQAANAHGFLPARRQMARRTRTLPDGAKFELHVMDACPKSLEAHVTDMERSVRPFLGDKRRNLFNLKPVFLLQGSRGSGKRLIASSLADRLGMHRCEISSTDLVSPNYAQSESKLSNALFRARLSAPCVLTFLNFENYGKNNEGRHDRRIASYFRAELDAVFEIPADFPVVLICLSDSRGDMPVELARCFLKIFDVGVPDVEQRREMLTWMMKEQDLGSSVSERDLVAIANRTRGFHFGDLEALVRQGRLLALERGTGGESVTGEILSSALDLMQAEYTESLGAPKIPKVSWEDVGGLSDVKREIVKTIELPLKHPELLGTSGLKRSGILLYGPPGTGKTLLAKAVATECNLCFLSVKGPELLNMYVGQSEKNIRDVFEKAREASPCIIFFDELDSLAPNRGVSGDSGGVMDRVVSQLLAEMDGLDGRDSGSSVFVIAATNRPDLLDQALLRPGRLDRLLYVGPCADPESKESVLRALTRKFTLAPDANLREVVKMCPEGVTGADFYGLASGAWMSAAKRLIDAGGDDSSSTLRTERDVAVNLQDFRNSLDTLKPSVSPQDLAYFERLTKEFGGGGRERGRDETLET